MALGSNRRSSSSDSRRSSSQSRQSSRQSRPASSRTKAQRQVNSSTRRPSTRSSRPQSSRLRSQRLRSSGDQLKRAPVKGSARALLSSVAIRFIFIALAVIVVLVLLWTAISSIPFLKVDNIEVSPTEHLSQASLAANIQIPEGSSILTLDTDALEEQIKKNPWVDQVKIDKKFPSTIHVSVTERKLGAIVVAKGGDEAWYMGVDGTWLEPIPFLITKPEAQSTASTLASAMAQENSSDEQKGKNDNKDDKEKKVNKDNKDDKDKKGSKESSETSLPMSLDSSAHAAINESNSISGQASKRAKKEGVVLIYDIDPGLEPKANTQVKDSGLSGALNYLESFSPNMLSHINYMVAPNKSSITMMLDNGVQVALGEPGSESNIKLKETVISNLLAEHQNEVTYINVRVPNQPAWRGLKNS